MWYESWKTTKSWLPCNRNINIQNSDTIFLSPNETQKAAYPFEVQCCVCATKIFLRARGVPFKLKEIYFGANPRGAKVQIWIFKSCDIFKILVTGGLLNVDMYVSGVLHYNLIMEFMFTGHR